jgi:hypothetical protein
MYPGIGCVPLRAPQHPMARPAYKKAPDAGAFLFRGSRTALPLFRSRIGRTRAAGWRVGLEFLALFFRAFLQFLLQLLLVFL